MAYWPAPDQWESCDPARAGLDPPALAEAVAYHRAHETPWRPDFLTESGRYIGVADEPPAPREVLGPVRPRAAPTASCCAAGASWPSGATRRGRT
jgi:hypothetical protein